MIPQGIDFKEEMGQQPSLTFKIDFIRNKIVDKIDGLEAVKQAVFLLLSTERDYSEIYEDYGIKLDDLIGLDISFVASELKRRIIESLKEDDRIIDVKDFTFNGVDDGLEVGFTVDSKSGSFISKEVFKL